MEADHPTQGAEDPLTRYIVSLGDTLKKDKAELLEQIRQAKERNKEDLQFLYTAQLHLENAGDLIKEIDKLSNKEEIVKQLKSILVLRVKALLDASFFHETELVEEEFPEEKSSTLNHIFQVLQDIKGCAYQLAVPLGHEQNDEGLIQVLGVDLVEVMHWRRGALHYMNIATAVKCNRLMQIHESAFSECVQEFDAMLTIRKERLDVPEDDLLSNHGVFSSTHLLAMVYWWGNLFSNLTVISGEVCFWRHTLVSPSPEFKSKAVEMLSLYKDIVDQLPAMYGWSSERAKELLQQLTT